MTHSSFDKRYSDNSSLLVERGRARDFLAVAVASPQGKGPATLKAMTKGKLQT